MTPTTSDQEWLTDTNGNRCSVSYFGSVDAARRALDSLKNCRDCVNCSYCSRCSDCSYCSYCSRCSRCVNCSDCSGCSGCSGCSDCSDCRNKIGENGQDLQTYSGQPDIPVIPDIDKAVYAAASQPHALDMRKWHCGTTHCRAGWVVTLAGEQGKKLEEFFNTELAAMLIYRASGSPINPGRFYDSNADALEDMRKRAEEPRQEGDQAEAGAGEL